MSAAQSSSFVLEQLSTGSHAHGFGQVGDGRDFAFRVRANSAVVEIYRQDATTGFPQPEDVEATAQRPLLGVDVTDPRGVEALVRDLVDAAQPVVVPKETTVRAFLSRLGVLDGL